MTKTLMTLLLFSLVTTCFSQQKSTWDKWSWLTGMWTGSGIGQPGQIEGVFNFSPDLDQKIMVRKSHSEYPASGNKAKVIHDDLMIIYPDYSGDPVKAIYFDNEGHTINYTITYADKSIILTSGKMPNTPVFRLTYIKLEHEMVNTKFEISQDGEKFSTYIEGKSKRIN